MELPGIEPPSKMFLTCDNAGINTRNAEWREMTRGYAEGVDGINGTPDRSASQLRRDVPSNQRLQRPRLAQSVPSPGKDGQAGVRWIGRWVGPRNELWVDHMVEPLGLRRLTWVTSCRSTAWASIRASGAPMHMCAP